MKKLLAACLIVGTAWPAWAAQGPAGLGIIAGDPTGVTGKLWLSRTHAVDLGIGFSGDAAFYADYIWHGWDVLPQPDRGRLGAYLAAGPRIETERDTAFGIRTMGGLAYLIAGRPIELFLEAGPVFQLAPDRGVDVDAGLGVRFYWGGTPGE